ncbi:MAG: ATP-binding protein [Myxococcales bacterium]|nr:ATP-binding protein [Myxococcota bacterium]MDW8282740.1 ATP-binding protein [Myxococcales bacterium]
MHELLVPLLAVAALGAFAAFVLLRLWRARRSGLSIRLQVFVSMAVVSGGFAALLGLIAVNHMEARSAMLAAEVAEEDAQIMARLLGAGDRPLAEMATRALGGLGPSRLRVEIRDAQGRLLHAIGPPEQAGPQRRAAVLRQGRVIGEVRVARGTVSWRQILRDVASRAAVLSLLLVIGTASAAALVGRAIAKPIERLTHAASRIAHGERQAVLPRPVGREVRTLTAAVESMRRELEGRHLAEQLATDLSHQLKNPVAAIRASAEVLADGALEEPEAARRFVGRILEAAERLLTLVNNLLALTRLQARGVETEIVDAADLARQSVDAHGAQAERQRLRIELSAPPGAPVRGDRAWLRRAIDNLVDNALAFADPSLAPGESPISVSVRTVDQWVVIEVANAGPGIDPKVEKRLFERFVTTRRDMSGTGLGLAIVAAVAEQHGGQVEVAQPGPPITVFRLTLPRASATLHQIFP